MSIVVETLAAVANREGKWSKLDIRQEEVGRAHLSALLGTAQVLRTALALGI